MKKYQIMIVAEAGLLSFGASFGVNWFKQQKSAAAAVLPPEQTVSDGRPKTTQSETVMSSSFSGPRDADPGQEQSGLTERQLQNLIYDVRQKMHDYAERERELDQEAERIDIARISLQDDIEELNSLREKLDLTLAAMKEKEESIQKSLIEIKAVEKTNFQRLAATYEKMDAAQAAKIMVSMAANNQLQDVVKILYYMNDRNAGKILGEIGSTRAEVAGVLSLQLKLVKEESD